MKRVFTEHKVFWIGTIVAIIAAIFLPNLLFAQETQSQATSGSASGASAGAISGTTTNNTYTNSKDTTLRSMAAVSAPAVFGGGHPCLAGVSAGAGIVGYGLSGGKSSAEPVCMLWYMGQPEAAIRALAATNPVACEALNNVGYYRVAGQTANFECGEPTRKGGVFTGTKTAPSSGFTKCERRADNSILIKYSAAGRSNKTLAQKNCSASLR